jgi:hypothetical protein
MAPVGDSPSLGSHLRALRSGAGGSLADMAGATRITERHLRALESDALDELPAPVFVKGFIRAYCEFLGAPAEEALALYDRARGAPPTVPARVLPPHQRTAWFGHPLAIGGALLLIFGGGLLALRLGPPPASRAPESAATVPAPAMPPTVSPAAPPGAAAPVPVTPQPDVAETQRLVVKAVEPTWIRVQADEGRAVEELLAPGAQREWIAGKRFVLTIGNAGGIQIELNGRTLPSLGARGAVIHRLSLPGIPPTGS